MKKLIIPRAANLLLACSLLTGSAAISQNYTDCDSAFWIGTNYVSHFVAAYGEGNDREEAVMIPCFMNGESFGQAEKNSTWIRFTIDQPGTLRFSITPDSLDDDYDFVLFQIPEKGGCKDKIVVRCMAAGDENREKSPCRGATGLRDKEKDTTEDAGCSDPGDNNWLKPLPVKPGETYVLLASNITNPINGFVLRFTGDYTFKERPEQ